MAMRPRGGGAAAPRRGARTGAVRAVYEDFRPISDWQQDDGSHILNIYLPGFMKEQIKVSTEGRNIIRVRGERLVAGNKWSRFSEDFQVPENGEMNSVRAKFQGGILNITIPRKVDKPQETTLTPKPKSNSVQAQPTPIKDQAKVFQEASTSQPADEKSTEQQKTHVDPIKNQINNGAQKGQDKSFPSVGTSQSADDKSIEPQKAADDYTRESNEKNIASGGRDDVTAKIVGKEENAKKLPEDKTPKKITMDKDGATSKPENKADNKEFIEASTKEKYKKAVKGLAELNEERQLLVNMGVAMLVIVALTAYVTYKFASEKDKN